MNDRDFVDLYSQRREEYLALRKRMTSLKREIQDHLERGDSEAFQDARCHADTVARSLHRVQDSMWFLEDKVCDILRSGRPRTP